MRRRWRSGLPGPRGRMVARPPACTLGVREQFGGLPMFRGQIRDFPHAGATSWCGNRFELSTYAFVFHLCYKNLVSSVAGTNEKTEAKIPLLLKYFSTRGGACRCHLLLSDLRLWVYSVDHKGFGTPRFGGNETKCASRKALKLIAWMKIDF
jgi:hypothetical protein